MDKNFDSSEEKREEKFLREIEKKEKRRIYICVFSDLEKNDDNK